MRTSALLLPMVDLAVNITREAMFVFPKPLLWPKHLKPQHFCLIKVGESDPHEQDRLLEYGCISDDNQYFVLRQNFIWCQEYDVEFVFDANSDIILECEQCMRRPRLTFCCWRDLPDCINPTNVIRLDEVLLFYIKLRKKFEEPCLADIVMVYMGFEELLELMVEKSDKRVSVNIDNILFYWDSLRDSPSDSW